jgi:pimeloyl-ACP methyl ester carboxylesterase
LVDIGGWRLHLYCTGEAKPAQPTVILEAGLGDFSLEWSLVQPKLATFARVCSYDRAGTGWSELGPHPRPMHQIVHELHLMLEKASVRPLLFWWGTPMEAGSCGFTRRNTLRKSLEWSLLKVGSTIRGGW